jgi:hypothetical protein
MDPALIPRLAREAGIATQGTANDAMDYRRRLQWWYASMFGAARRGEEFNEPRPEPRIAQAIREQFKEQP